MHKEKSKQYADFLKGPAWRGDRRPPSSRIHLKSVEGLIKLLMVFSSTVLDAELVVGFHGKSWYGLEGQIITLATIEQIDTLHLYKSISLLNESPNL